MALLIKAAALAAAASILALTLKKPGPELALCLSLAAAALIMLMALGPASEILALASEAAEISGLSGAVLSPVLKCLGLAVVAKLASELCRDAGQGGLASGVELCAALCALYVALPLFRALLEMTGELL